jgi:hypothetical protein
MGLRGTQLVGSISYTLVRNEGASFYWKELAKVTSKGKEAIEEDDEEEDDDEDGSEGDEEDDCWVMTSPLGTPRGRCDEYSSKIFPQLRNQGMSIRRGANKRLKVMLDSLVTLQQGRRFTTKRVSASSASSNMEPAHNTTKYFVPNLR